MQTASLLSQEVGPNNQPEGPPLLTNTLHEGESVGDVDVVDNAHRSVSCISLEQGARIVVVSRALFLSFVSRHPKALQSYLQQAIARLWCAPAAVCCCLRRALQPPWPLGTARAGSESERGSHPLRRRVAHFVLADFLGLPRYMQARPATAPL